MEMMMMMLPTNINIKMLLMLVLVYGCLESPPPVPSCWLLLHVLVVVGTTKIGHSPVVVVTEIHCSSSTTIPDVVHPLSRLKIPVKLPRLQGASSLCSGRPRCPRRGCSASRCPVHPCCMDTAHHYHACLRRSNRSEQKSCLQDNSSRGCNGALLCSHCSG